MTQTTQSEHVQTDLGDGLVLRRATPADAEAVAELTSNIFGATPEDIESGRREAIAVMSGRHPILDASDFTLVADTRAGKVVSSLCLISQKWTYGGIEFGVGQVEAVATHADYRRRGLIRAQFDAVHRWSAERGEMVTAVDGIPWFYRQFGYEMALENGGGRVGYPHSVPQLKEGETEPYHARPATEDDLAFIKRTSDSAGHRCLVANKRDESFWKFILSSSIADRKLRVVETANGGPVGVLVHVDRLRGGQLGLLRYDLVPGVSWLAVTPSVIRYLQKTGEEYAARNEQQFNKLGFWLGSQHPACQAMESYLPGTVRPYAWYIRMLDVAGFIRHVTPVLEQRLAESIAASHTCELKISFAKGGLRMVLERGRVTEVEPWGAPDQDTLLDWRSRDAIFPGLIFLKLLFGYRSVEDLEYAFPDCGASSDETRALLNILFPKQLSQVYPNG